jgi:hypothetical protein
VDEPRSGEAAGSRRTRLLCQFVLVALPILLFRSHVFRQVTYIGNPDRLNSHLKILRLHVDGLATGQMQAWSDYEMLGFDSFTMPYTFPNPLTYVTAWWGPHNLYVTAGYVSVLLMILSGIAAYAYLHRLTDARDASLVGALLYQFAAGSVLSVSQNDLSFAVFILIPLMALAVRATAVGTLVISYCSLSLLLFALLHFTFLQYAAYAVMLIGAYAAYRSLSTQAWGAAPVFAAALLTACVGALPRVYGVGRAMAEYTRSPLRSSADGFESVYEFQNIRPYELLRWFDNTIFGAFPSDAAVRLGNNVNLTEGFLLFTSGAVPLLVGYGIVRYRSSWFTLLVTRERDAGFLLWAMLSTFGVLLFKPLTHLLYLVFLRVDFTHARVLTAGLLPLVGVVALLLRDIRPSVVPIRRAIAFAVLGLLLAGGAAGTIEWLVAADGGSCEIALIPLRVSRAALGRIGGSALVAAVLLGMLRLAAGNVRLVAYAALCGFIVVQTVVGAEFQVNGSYTRRPAPAFQSGDIHAAGASDFRPPPEAAVEMLRSRVEGEQFRSAIVCPAAVVGTFCGGHIPAFWKLRVLDGYYGLGVPTRLAVLPWKGVVSLRTIGAQAAEELEWPLLGLLNVKYAIVVNGDFYRNRAGTARGATELAETVVRLENPSRVVPRAFFARSVEAVSDPQDAVRRMFDESVSPRDLVATSYVEGWVGQGAFAGGGAVNLRGSGDEISLRLEPSEASRFLVLNELYFPGWRAEIDGSPATIYPTNAFMRGILVPPGGQEVSLRFVPFVRSAPADAMYAAAVMLLAALAPVFRRWDRQARGMPVENA